MAFISAPKIITDGLALSLDAGDKNSYPESGTTWSDLSGNGNDGTLTAASIGTDVPESMDFNGSSEYVDFGSDVMFKSGGGWTVESWVKPDAVSSGPYNFIGSAAINYNSWYWSVLSSKLAMWDLSPGSVWKYGNTTLSTGQWYHAVLVSDPDNTSYYIYLNGEDDMSSGWSSYNGSWQSSRSSLAVAYLGRGSAAHARYWDGQMGKVTFYQTALTAAQIKTNFNAQRSRFGV